MSFPKYLEPLLVFCGLLHFKYHSFSYCKKNKTLVNADQFKQLKRLLCTSYDEIPFYNKKYRAAEFNPYTDFETLMDINKVPVLTKLEARINQQELMNKNRINWALEFKTSGSTGNPFTAFVSPFHWIIEQSCVWRHWSWAGYKFRDKVAIVRSHVPKNENDLIKIDRLRNFYYFSPFHLTDKHIKYYLNQMIELGITFLRGYPSSILAIANFIKNNPEVSFPKFKGILTASERLGEYEKNIIESNLKAPVFNHYGLAEQIVMFGGCENGTHMHNYEEYGFLELIDTNKLNYKKIIGTNLNNFAMPLIRYETGDIAEVTDTDCSCERTSTTILNVVGREDATIILSDDSHIPVTNFYTMFEYYGDYFSAWQLIQLSKSELLVVVDLYDQNLKMKVQKLLINDIEKRIGKKLAVSFNFTGKFKYVGEGKRNPFIRQFK